MGKWNDKDFTKYDDKGVPTHWIKEEKSKKSPDFGKKIEKEINEQERKKLIFAQEKHAKVYEKAIADQAKGPKQEKKPAKKPEAEAA